MVMTESQVDYSCLYGVTHDINARPIVRQPKLLKVSIGAPKGKAILVYTQATDKPDVVKWWIKVGVGDSAKAHPFATRQETEKAYRELFKTAPETSYPRKIGFFTFTRPTADGLMEPDFEAIEAHGPMPTEIDVVFMSDEAFEAAFAMWSATELRCKGNGVNAERLVRFILEDKTATSDEKQLAELAKESGASRVLLHNCCWTKGCRFSKPEVRGSKEFPSPCKPSGDLKFQLANKLRVGGTSYFHTSGFRSITQIFSALQIFRTLTGRGDWTRGYLAGLPFLMVLRPYKTKHNGQTATQFGVSLEFRAETVAQLKQKLLEQSFEFRQNFGMPRQLAGGDPIGVVAEADDLIDEELDDEIPASAIAAEFYPEATEDGSESGEPQPTTGNSQAAAATQEKTATLRDRVNAARPKPAPAPAPAAASPQASAPKAEQKSKEFFF